MSNFNSPEFLQCAVKHGLLSSSADAMDAYQLYGFLIRDEAFRQRRLKLGLALSFEKVLATLSPAELQGLNERAAGVLRFRSKK